MVPAWHSPHLPTSPTSPLTQRPPSLHSSRPPASTPLPSLHATPQPPPFQAQSPLWVSSIHTPTLAAEWPGALDRAFHSPPALPPKPRPRPFPSHPSALDRSLGRPAPALGPSTGVSAMNRTPRSGVVSAPFVRCPRAPHGPGAQRTRSEPTERRKPGRDT